MKYCVYRVNGVEWKLHAVIMNCSEQVIPQKVKFCDFTRLVSYSFSHEQAIRLYIDKMFFCTTQLTYRSCCRVISFEIKMLLILKNGSNKSVKPILKQLSTSEIEGWVKGSGECSWNCKECNVKSI